MRRQHYRPGKLEGPHDFAWLLERVADFSAEDGTHHKHGWNVQQPPPPLQLLIPESVAVEPEGNSLRAMFFTDRGGILRGARQPISQEPQQVFQSMLTLTKQRNQNECDLIHAKAMSLAIIEDADEASPTASRRVALATLPESEPLFRGSQAQASRESSPERTKQHAASRRTITGVPRPHFNYLVGSSVCWRLVLESGAELKMTEHEVGPLFGVGQPTQGRLPGIRLLQVCFWLDCHGEEMGPKYEATTTVYHYNALQAEACICSSRVHRNDDGRNNYERKRQFEAMATQNLVSAVPILISQQVSYHHDLELVSGTFEFTLDNRGKLWLLDARKLNFIPCVAHGAGPTNGSISNNTSVMEQTARRGKKMFRYMSEEALNKMELDSNTCEKKNTMVTMMADHYQGIKDEHGIDDLLQKRDEIPELCVPVFIGTDRRALFRTLGAPDGVAVGSKGSAMTSRSRKNNIPKSCLPRRPPTANSMGRNRDAPGRQIAMVPRPPSANRRRPSIGRAETPLFNPFFDRVGTSRRTSGCSTPDTRDSSPTTSPRASARAESPRPSSRNSSPTVSRYSVARSASKFGLPVHNANAFEIVSSLEMPKLLAGSGPYMLPEGPILSELGPVTLSTPMAGLQAQKSTATSKIRLVKPSQGAAKTVAQQQVALTKMTQSLSVRSSVPAPSHASTKAQRAGRLMYIRETRKDRQKVDGC